MGAEISWEQHCRNMALLTLARLEKSDVGQALRSITEIDAKALGVDRVGAWFFTPDRRELVLAEQFLLTTGEHERGARLLASDYPMYFAALESSRMVSASRARTDLRTRELCASYLEPNGIHSMLDVPIWLGGALVGVLCHEHCGRPRDWTHDDEAFAANVADMVTTAIEASERTKAEQQLHHLIEEQRALAAQARRRTAEWEAVMESVGEAVMVLDANAHVIFVNAFIRQKLPWAGRDELLAPWSAWRERFIDLRDASGEPLPPDRQIPLLAIGGEAVRKAEATAYFPRTGELRQIRASATPLFGPQGESAGAVIVIVDVTEQRHFERLKDEFVDAAAHELRTPIAVLKGYSDVLLRLEGVPETMKKPVKAIQRGVARIEDIVDRLIETMRLELSERALGQESVDLRQVVESSVASAAEMGAHRVVLAPGGPLPVRCDRGRIGLVMRTLLSNAAKFSPAGGVIEVSTESREGEAVVSVRDYGVGIPADKQPHIFERFYRAHVGGDQHYSGIGLGLYVAREVVLLHGGRMWFESEEGRGSTFHFSLPLEK